MSKLLPFRQYNENDVINQFALNGTGEAGTFVAVSAGDLDNQYGWDWTNSPGAVHDDIHNFTHVQKALVRKCTSGDNSYAVIGVTLNDVAIYDENGEKYAYNKAKRIENGVVLSGQTVPILSRGIVCIKTGAYEGTPAIGSVITPSTTTDGAVAIQTVAAATANQILGTIIGSGTKQGGYMMVLLRR